MGPLSVTPSDIDRLRPLLDTGPVGRGASGEIGSPLSPGNPGSASEELTFQFSEVAEAQERTLEERLAEVHGGGEESISIEQVHRVLRIMEGREGYSQLRNLARQYAKARAEGDPNADDLLSLGSLKPEERYSMLRLASEAMEAAGHGDSKGTFDRELKSLTEDNNTALRGFFDMSSVARADLFKPRESTKQSSSPSFQLLAIKPTVRSMFDAAAEDSANLSASLSSMQRDWETDLKHYDELNAVRRVLSQLANVVRTMVFNAGELSRQCGGTRHLDPAETSADARKLIEIANGAAPGGQVDRLATSMLPQGGPQARLQLFRNLQRQLRHWPSAVWASPESKSLLQQHLIRKQEDDASFRFLRSPC